MEPNPAPSSSSEHHSNGESKPRLHLVKKVKNSVMPMQVEDEVEIMDDSEDELVVNRSAVVKRDYSRGNEIMTMDDDTEEELSICYDDHEQIKVENEDHPEDEQQQPDFEQDAQRIMNKRGKKINGSKSSEAETNGHTDHQLENDDNDSEDEKPLANRRRRAVIKVVEDLSYKEKTTKKAEVVEQEAAKVDDDDNEVVFANGTIKSEDSSDNVIEASNNDQDKSDAQSLAESLVEDEDLEEDTRSEVSAEEESLPSTFSLGSLAWARVGTAPYWPCVITPDPDFKSGIKFTHVKNHRQHGLKREYHVQFFGRIQRAWVVSSSMLKFEGLEAFNALSKNVTGSKSRLAFMPKSHNREIWNEAITNMTELEEKNNEDRLEICAKLFKDFKGQHSSKKRRRSSVETSSENSPMTSSDTSAKKPKIHEEAEKLIEAIPLKILEENRRKLKTGFKLFQLAHRQEVLKEHQEEDSGVEKILSKMWSLASAGEKRFFQDKAAAFLKPTSETNAENDTSETSSMTSETTEKPKTNKRASSSSSSIGAGTPKGNMIGLFKKESCCILCEEISQEPNDIIKCRGNCGGNAFHLSCLKDKGMEVVNNTDDKWKCNECSSNKHSCLLCKQFDNVVKCIHNGCGKYYHVDCLIKNGLWPQHRLAGDNCLTCPAHICHTCASDNPKDPFMKYNAKLVKCVRCPTAYHSNDYCVAAGTVQITVSQIVCPKHYKPDPKTLKKKVSTHINTSWCFICSSGGSLICCEQCPASFHVECLKIDPPEGKYFCDNCETGRMPLYGEVLWVKLGKYRWWPARVLHPSEVPANIEKLSHDVGEFPIQFCGSKEYAWMNRGRCFLYEEGDSDKIPGMSASGGGLDGSYSRGLSEAAEVFEQYNQLRQKRENENAAKGRSNSNLKPPMFNKIKTNRPFGDCPVYSVDPTDKQICECDPKSNNPCGPDADCINRLLMTECRPSTCRSGERCLNQRFQKRVYPALKVQRTPTRGWGLYVFNDVKKGDFLIEYVGELITMDEFRRRIEQSIERKEEQNYYYMTMDSQRMLDAGPRGNIARFMNHSCDPNAETQKWTVNGDTRVGLFALTDIPAGSELTFNYQFEAMGEVKKMCLCGAKNCSGYIGEKAKKKAKKWDESIVSSKKKSKQSLNKKQLAKAKNNGKVWEDLCFRCYDDGEVMMCDWKSCPKVYHLSCLGKEKKDREKWYCPWHHCVECGKQAVSHCIHCPNAYCKAHNTALRHHDELGSICDEHKDDIGDLILYYRRYGGIENLISHPSMAIAEVKNYEKAGATTESEKENHVDKQRDSLPFGLKNPFQYKCQVEGCGFRTRRTRLYTHYVNSHRLDAKKAEKMVPARLISPGMKDPQKLQCPLCDHRCVPMMLRKHLNQKHSQELTIEEINLVFEEAVNASQGQVLNKSQHGGSKPLVLTQNQTRELEKNPLFSKVQPDGRVACKAPDCKMTVSAQNISRHWNQYHPGLIKDDYQPSLRKLMKLCSRSDSPVVVEVVNNVSEKKTPSSTPSAAQNLKRLSCGNSGCNYRTTSRLKMSEHRKEKGHLTPGKRSKVTLPSSKSPSKLPLTKCGFVGCDFSTRYHSNLSRHRRRRNHFLTDEDRNEAVAEAQRDEIARQIEESKLESSSETEEEMDVTIPLAKKYSPSKITDYFKPLAASRKSIEAVRKNLDMSNNHDDEELKDGANSSTAAAAAENGASTAANADNKTRNQPEKPETASDNNDFVQTNKNVLEQ